MCAEELLHLWGEHGEEGLVKIPKEEGPEGGQINGGVYWAKGYGMVSVKFLRCGIGNVERSGWTLERASALA